MTHIDEKNAHRRNTKSELTPLNPVDIWYALQFLRFKNEILLFLITFIL